MSDFLGSVRSARQWRLISRGTPGLPYGIGPEPEQPSSQAGMTRALPRPPRDAAHDADVVITCLPTSRELEQLLDGPDGLLAGLRKGALFLDCSSGDPATSRRIAVLLAARDIAFADAPVSGGPTEPRLAP